MSTDLRLTAAVAAGKAAAATSRLLRRGGGTTIPGDVALALDRGVLRKLSPALPGGIVLVTGTNGKTTTTGLIAGALQRNGERVLTNSSGANLVFGLVAAAVADADLRGRPRSQTAVFEVDELHLDRAVIETRPRLVVVLNLLRDQLDRSGELETTAGRIGDALRKLPDSAQVVANVDDPLVAGQCRGLPNLVPIGVDAGEFLLPGLPHAADARACPVCNAPLRFSRVVLAHCGTYSCTACDFGRVQPAFALTHIDAPRIDALSLEVSDGAHIDAAVGGVYNAYNVLAAYATLRTMGISQAAATAGIARFHPRFGRQETLTLHGRTMRFLLAKNPAGFDEVLRTADELGAATTYLIAVNDRVADGRDVSWLWDVDFERLARSDREPHIVVAGTRAHDLALRLKYAGVPQERVTVETDPERALQLAASTGDAQTEVAVLPTYTAMLDLRAVAERAGAVAAFWQDPGRA
ncbi:MAG TPA: MurT ligase domain-containing protein [Candidatus Dormibacteraeota bacterium]|jgi:UDP-N-acetylmuramyl tripeptide synthase|nr:MurT ligase domain-containing protein [Candidatus Dormibacteraeota bacterium]